MQQADVVASSVDRVGSVALGGEHRAVADEVAFDEDTLNGAASPVSDHDHLGAGKQDVVAKDRILTAEELDDVGVAGPHPLGGTDGIALDQGVDRVVTVETLDLKTVLARRWGDHGVHDGGIVSCGDVRGRSASVDRLQATVVGAGAQVEERGNP